MAVLWGGNNIAIKFSLTGIPPFALAGIRFIVGSLIVLAWVYMDRVSLKMEAGEKGSLVLLAFLFHGPDQSSQCRGSTYTGRTIHHSDLYPSFFHRHICAHPALRRSNEAGQNSGDDTLVSGCIVYIRREFGA